MTMGRQAGSGAPMANDMAELLIAMKDGALADSTYLGFLSAVDIVSGPAVQLVLSQPTVLLEPTGSPEFAIGEYQDWRLKYALHQITIWCMIWEPGPVNADSVVGVTSNQIGIAPMVARVLDYFNGNLLGLSGLQAGSNEAPEAEAPEDAYSTVEVEGQDGWLRVCECKYQARTVPFER